MKVAYFNVELAKSHGSHYESHVKLAKSYVRRRSHSEVAISLLTEPTLGDLEGEGGVPHDGDLGGRATHQTCRKSKRGS